GARSRQCRLPAAVLQPAPSMAASQLPAVRPSTRRAPSRRGRSTILQPIAGAPRPTCRPRVTGLRCKASTGCSTSSVADRPRVSPSTRTTKPYDRSEEAKMRPDLLDEDALLDQCEVDTLRASGPGGQKRNKTESAVRMRHKPSGIIVVANESR